MSSDGDVVANQFECTEAVLEVTPEVNIISNLGVASRVLHAVSDRDRNFYLTGAMGGTTPLGFGVAVSTDEPVTVLDGDGSMLMSLGCLGTVGKYNPSNLTIVVWVNKSFGTTGGQPTHADVVDIAGVAAECSLTAYHVSTVSDFTAAYESVVSSDEAGVIACAVEPVVDLDESYPLDVTMTKRRFKGALTESN